jgi:hypothetical protein
VPFWPYWSSTEGCDKTAWLAEHRKRHGRRKATRERLERFIAAVAPYKVLELNIYDEYSRELSELPAVRRNTTVFDHMLDVAPPKVLLVHGDAPRRHLERLLRRPDPLPTDRFVKARHGSNEFLVFAAAQHFRNASYSYVEAIATKLKSRLDSGSPR